MKSIRIKIDERKALKKLYAEMLHFGSPVVSIPVNDRCESVKQALPDSYRRWVVIYCKDLSHVAEIHGQWGTGPLYERGKIEDGADTERDSGHPAYIMHWAHRTSKYRKGFECRHLKSVLCENPAELILDTSPMFHRCVQRIIEKFAK